MWVSGDLYKNKEWKANLLMQALLSATQPQMHLFLSGTNMAFIYIFDSTDQEHAMGEMSHHLDCVIPEERFLKGVLSRFSKGIIWLWGAALHFFHCLLIRTKSSVFCMEKQVFVFDDKDGFMPKDFVTSVKNYICSNHICGHAKVT